MSARRTAGISPTAHRSTSRASGTTSSSYGVDPETEMIDYDEVERIAKETRPKMIVAGASAYPRDHRLRALRGDRQGRRRLPDGRHGAHRGSRRCGSASLAGPARRLRHLDIPQDTARPALRLRAVQGGACRRTRQGGVPGPAGRPARAHRSPPRPSPSKRPCSRSSRPTSIRSSSNAQAMGAAHDRVRPEARLRRHRQPPDAGGPHGRQASRARTPRAARDAWASR